MLLLSGCIGFSQSELTRELDSINTVEEAEAFISNGGNSHSIIIFNREKHKTQLADKLFNMDIGGRTSTGSPDEQVHYKVIERQEVLYYRVNYIFVSGSMKTQAEMDDLKSRIMTKLNHGVPFTIVANEYSMDRNKSRGGDSGWITYGDMQESFEQAVLNTGRRQGELFVLDVPQGFYVIRKTHEEQAIPEIKILKIIERAR